MSECGMSVEWHSSRYGVPGTLFVDNWTQLIALTSANFTPRTLENELRGKLDIRVVVLCPKAHRERGRVERRIGLIRQMLQQTGEDVPSPPSPLMLETKFARIANVLNNLPLANDSSTGLKTENFEIIKQNRLLLRTSRRCLLGATRSSEYGTRCILTIFTF